MAHIEHLIEDHDLAFNEMLNIVSAAAKGELPDVSEKLDGVNIVFTCTPKYEVRFARSDSDIRSGGMIAAVLEAKYAGRGLVQETFVKGAEAMRHAVRALSPSELAKAFDGSNLWYSAEIIYTKNPNVIRYANDSVVFHKRPVLRLEGESVVKTSSDRFQHLERCIPDMSAPGWSVHGPQIVALPNVCDTYEFKELSFYIDSMDVYNIREYLHDRAHHELKALGLTGATLGAAVARLIEEDGCPSLTTLKPKLPARAVEMLRNSSVWTKKHLSELDHKLTRFASALLKDVRSNLVADPDLERARVLDQLGESCALIVKSRNQAAIDLMEEQLARLAGHRSLVGAVEGIVFPWGDKVYKLTGAFAPANAIIGLVKYGRGKAVPPLKPM